MNTEIENIIETAYRNLIDEDYEEKENGYIKLYSNIEDLKLREVLAILHNKLIALFEVMNKRLPTTYRDSYFHAAQSRALLKVIDISLNLEKDLTNTEFSFFIDPDYKKLFIQMKKILKKYNGSTLPIGLEKIKLYYKIPIFKLSSNVKIYRNKEIFYYETQLIGSGSYANVYKYKDTFYNKIFALKKLKNNLSQKEQERFKKEYEIMDSLKSPYIIEVYNYNDQEHKYIMEFMDYTLKSFIDKYNNILTRKDRKSLILQTLKAFKYLHSKKILHRDISYTNILLKEYDDDNIIKLSDFGLAKTKDSLLTSKGTEIKGSLNDPALKTIGFKNYQMCHEIYALTQIIFFIMTGKTNLEKAKEIEKELIDIGLNVDITKRFKDTNDIKDFILTKYK